MDTMHTSSDDQVNGQDSLTPAQNPNLTDDHPELQLENTTLLAELNALRESYQNLQSRLIEKEEELKHLQREKEDVLMQNSGLAKAIKEVSRERDSFSDEIDKLTASFEEREEKLVQEKEEIRHETVKIFSKNMDVLKQAKEVLTRVIKSLDEDKVEKLDIECEEKREESEEMSEFSSGLNTISRLVDRVELKLNDYKEKRKKEKRELESSVVSLTEENRDMNSLLRIALMEKHAIERSFNRLKGNNEQRRAAILQIAEKGLQKVGFGFMMAGTANEQPSENEGANPGAKSDTYECDEEVVSLASTVERIMKNLRLEITQLRRSLEETRSDNECLQILIEKQAQELAANMLYIKELENRKMILAQKAEELLVEIQETEEEVVRWREACKLEVEAGKNIAEERDKLVNILTQELEKTRGALDVSNGKLKLKDELAAAAVAAQKAAERSLQLADSRAVALRAQIEELARQLEEADKKEQSYRRKVRHICWPWQIKLNTTSNTSNGFRNVRRRLPEMQALLH